MNARPRLRIQLWCWNYEPEPTAMGPMAAAWSRAMSARGHDIEVVTSHPHYPGALWGQRLMPYRERRDGIPVVRLPLWIGRRTTVRRVLEEFTYSSAAGVAMGVLRRPDVAVVVSPAFLPLAPFVVNARLRRLPWILWLEDVLPDAAATTGLLDSSVLLALARKLELTAYASATRIVVISRAFGENLRKKGVPAAKIAHVYNPCTRPLRKSARTEPRRILYMGNIGYSQNLPALVRAFEASPISQDLTLVIAGSGEQAEEVRQEIRSDRVVMTGLLLAEMEDELERAAIGLVPQRADIDEFNLPSKLMNFMARGVPVLASVRPDAEVARIVRESRGGWVADAREPETFVGLARSVLDDAVEVNARASAAFAFAQTQFAPEVVAERFERVLREALTERRPRR